MSDPVPRPDDDPSPILYRAIATSLRKEIFAGQWKPGERIPPEPELAGRFRVSQGTVRLAVLELVKSGLLYRQQGRGTFVRPLRMDQSLERFFRYTSTLAGKDFTPETRVLGTGVAIADKRTQEVLGLSSRAKVGWLRRLRVDAGDPFLLHDSYFPLDLWSTMIKKCDFREPALYSQLQERCETPVVSADEYLAPRIATAEEAKLLRIATGSAVAHLERHSYSFGRRAIEFRRSTGRGDRFSYHVQL